MKVLLINGSPKAKGNTALALAEMARVFEERIPDAGLVTVEGAGHYAYLERPGYVYPVLDAFFGGK